MNSYQLIGGDHVEDGKKYTKGQVVKSSRNLPELFVGKFIVAPADVVGTGGEDTVPATPLPPIPTPIQQKGKEVAGKSVPATDAPDAKEVGEDVTRSFPIAVDVDLQVRKVSARRYNVYDPDEDQPLNKSPLPKEGVDSLLKTYAEA